MFAKALFTFFVFTILTTNGVSAQEDWFPVHAVDDHLYVATDTLPANIEPSTLANLFIYLQDHIDARSDSEFAPWLGNSPGVLVRFVSPSIRTPFPHGTESYGGMTGWASWECLPPSGLCRLREAVDVPGEGAILVALVAETPLYAENLGLVAHELSHVLGTVDGPRCPYHADYHPGQVLPPDTGDAYWWYGVTGVFTLQPVGVVWDALNAQCDSSDSPDVCEELQMLLGE